MSKIAVVYWSGTGNTEAMAKAVEKGAAAAGGTVDLFSAGDFNPQQAENYDALAFGCPSMGAEELESGEFEPMYDAVESKLAGKKAAFFGSYGWGDGQWMRDWEERASKAGVKLCCEPVIAQEAPDAEAEAACEALGKALA